MSEQNQEQLSTNQKLLELWRGSGKEMINQLKHAKRDEKEKLQLDHAAIEQKLVKADSC